MELAAAAVARDAKASQTDLHLETADGAVALTAWIDDVTVPPCASQVGSDTWTVDHDDLSAALLNEATSRSMPSAMYKPLFEALSAVDLVPFEFLELEDGHALVALRADSPGAPETHAQAAADPKWVKAEGGEHGVNAAITEP